MPAVYVEKFGGFIADNPNIDFVRCDGRVFAYDKVSTSGFTNGNETLTINGGQGSFPLAYLDTTKTLEFTFEIADFDMEMFEMANATSLTNGDYGTVETKLYDVDANLKITIPFECKTGSVKINGFVEDTTASAGKFAVTVTAAAAATAGSTEVAFYTGDVAANDTIRVSYQRRIVNAERMNVKTTSTSSKGALYAHYPVYSDGSNCVDAAVKAWVHIEIPRVRATALPGMSSSYKTAA